MRSGLTHSTAGYSKLALSADDYVESALSERPAKRLCALWLRQAALISLLVALLTVIALLVLEPGLLFRAPQWQLAVGAAQSPSTRSPLSSRYPICSAIGQQLWMHRYHAAHTFPLSSSTPLRADSGSVFDSSPPPEPEVDPLLWHNRTLQTNTTDEEVHTLARDMCQHTGIDLPVWMVEMEDKKQFRPPHLLSHTLLPPFPFPSLRATFDSLPQTPPFRHPESRTADGLLENGAQVPRNYMEYTDDAQLMRDSWPACFDNISANLSQLTDLRSFLADIRARNLSPASLASLLTAAQLNPLALSLNFDRYPVHSFPPAGVPSIPIVITSVDKYLRAKVPALGKLLRGIIGVQDSTVFLSTEGASVDTLQLVADHIDSARVILYFTPIDECQRYRPYAANVGKSWRIDFSLLFVMHIVYNLYHYEYAVVVEDDIEVSRDVYLYHLSLFRYAVDTPYIMAVQANTYHPYIHCYQFSAHMRGRFVGNLSDPMDIGAPDILDKLTSRDPLWRTVRSQSQLMPYTFTDTHQLLLGRLIVPWAAGYTKKVYAYILNFYLHYAGSLELVRYDRIAQHIMSPSAANRTDLYSIVPVIPRVHGDARYIPKHIDDIPMVTACRHSEYDIVFPVEKRTRIEVGQWMERYDYVEVREEEQEWLPLVTSLR